MGGYSGKYEIYVEPYLEQIKEWAGVLSEAQIAERLGIREETFSRYKKKHPEIIEAIVAGKKSLAQVLKETLKKKALGFSYKEKKTTVQDDGGKKKRVVEEYERYSPPDTGALHLLLKNVDPEWRNDDMVTINLKKEKLELDRQKADDANW